MSDRFLPKRDNVKASISKAELKYDGFSKLTECLMSYTHSNGEPAEALREVHDHGHGACVLPVDRERRVAMLVRQLRVTLLVNGDPDPMLLEVAAGLIDEGETAEQAALREAEEELGYRVRDIQPVTVYYPSPGIVAETISCFFASYSLEDKIGDGGGLDHEDEDIIIEEIALDELGEAVLRGNLRDGKTIMLIQQLMLSEPELFF